MWHARGFLVSAEPAAPAQGMDTPGAGGRGQASALVSRIHDPGSPSLVSATST